MVSHLPLGPDPSKPTVSSPPRPQTIGHYQTSLRSNSVVDHPASSMVMINYSTSNRSAPLPPTTIPSLVFHALQMTV